MSKSGVELPEALFQVPSADLLSHVFSRADQQTTLWTVYLSVIGAVFALLKAYSGHPNETIVRKLMAIVFAIFAFVSANAIFQLDRLRLRLIGRLPEDLVSLAQLAEPSPVFITLAAHIALDALILCLILRRPARWFKPQTQPQIHVPQTTTPNPSTRTSLRVKPF